MRMESMEWIWVLVRIAVTILVTVILLRLNRWAYNRSKHKFLFKKFVFSFVSFAIFIIGFLTALDAIPQLHQLVTTLLAGSGIAALAVSLSAQESLENIISGIFLTIFKPFEVGDRVTLINEKQTGFIEDITPRHTIIRTYTNTRIVIPNSTISKDVIENSNLVDARAANFLDVIISYGSDVDLAMQLMREIVVSHPLFLDTRTDPNAPLVTILLRELGPYGMCLRATVWTRTVSENFQACSDMRVAIVKSFRNAGIGIPYQKVVITPTTPEQGDSIHFVGV